jgi:hypothetical protein
VEKSCAGFLLGNIGINFDINVGKATLEQNFDVSIVRAACEACSATWNLGVNTEFAI